MKERNEGSKEWEKEAGIKTGVRRVREGLLGADRCTEGGQVKGRRIRKRKTKVDG